MTIRDEKTGIIGTGELIKNMRKASGLTQRELGKEIGMADTAISAYEREAQNITVKTFLKIAEVCDFSVRLTITDNESDESFRITTKNNA